MQPSRALLADNRQMLGKLAVVVALMFAFGYAMVPIYRAVCEALGINVLSVAELRTRALQGGAVNGQIDASRIVTVVFDANSRGPWDFRPERASLDVHPGQLATMIYEIRNRQPRAMTAQAIPSYAPQVAMSHFTKLECFCFAEHVLAPNETKRWPVTFVVDARLPKDVRTIILSYTFFEVGGKIPAPPAEARAPELQQGARS